MSNGYGCEFCDGKRPVQWLLTNLAAGATLSACAEDFPVALIPVLAGELGADPGRMYDAIKAVVDAEAAQVTAETTAGGTVVPQPGPGQPATPGPGNGQPDDPPGMPPTSRATPKRPSKAARP
jgi:hypothetical protein